MAKIFNLYIGLILVILLIFAGVQTHRVSTLSESVEQYRSNLEDARRANDRYADAYRQATETNTELGECLSEHVTTLSQLREQLEAVRRGYRDMQAIFKVLADNGDIVIDNDSSDSGSK